MMDMVNGSFELGGALCSLLSVRQLWIDKRLAGVHWLPTLYFFVWGVWNIFYYPSLNQWWSFLGGCAIVAVNCLWLCSLLWFRWREKVQTRDLEATG